LPKHVLVILALLKGVGNGAVVMNRTWELGFGVYRQHGVPNLWIEIVEAAVESSLRHEKEKGGVNREVGHT